MKRLLLAALLCSAGALHAEEAPRATFPDDYTPTTCPTVSCDSYEESEMRSAAGRFLGLTLDLDWMHAHLPQLKREFEPLCKKATTCFATTPNTNMFCMDVLAPEFRAICARDFPKEKSPGEYQKCYEVVETYLLGLDQRMRPRFDETRACAAKNDPARTNKTLDVWMVPSKITLPAKEVKLNFSAIDRDTHVPVLAAIQVEGQSLYAPANPAGSLATGYEFKWPVQFVRTKNAAGRVEATAPLVTITADGYAPVTMRMPVDVPQVVVTTTPALRRGRTQRVTISAKDAKTGEPVTGRVVVGNKTAGQIGQRLKLDLRKNAEVWLADLSDGASDVQVK